MFLLSYNLPQMKTIIYIDGQNFLYKASDVLIAAGKITDKQELHTISIRKLFEELLQEADVEIRYYGTKLKKYKNTTEILEKSKVMIDSQRRLRNSLAKQKVEFIESGRLKLRDGDKCKSCDAQDLHFQEKGVDVKIAVDMILDSASEDIKVVLVSSDNDLLPAVTAVAARGNHVTYVGFGDYLTKALVANASEVQVIRNAEVIAAFEDANPQLELTEASSGHTDSGS